jgi:hypothetical protein
MILEHKYDVKKKKIYENMYIHNKILQTIQITYNKLNIICIFLYKTS